MKKVILDVNIFKKDKIEKIINSSIVKKLGKSIKLYASEACLRQRLPFLYENKMFEDYDYYVDFIKKYCEKEIIDAPINILGKELRSKFTYTELFGASTDGLYYHNDTRNKIAEYDIMAKHEQKINVMKNIQIFVNEHKPSITQAYNVIIWKDYCSNFIAKYNFAVPQLLTFLITQQRYDKQVFINLIKLWWRYSTIAGTLEHFGLKNATLDEFYTLVNDNIPKNSFAYRKFKADDFIIDYSLELLKKVDKDTPNDTTYIANMNHFDILLTDDGKSHDTFMKSCFKHVYSDSPQKEILNLDEFINKYA